MTLTRDKTDRLAVFQLQANAAAEAELEWFFNMAEGEIGVGSTFLALLASIGEPTERRTPEDRLEAAGAYRLIEGWLRALPEPDAGVLAAAYQPRVWPRGLLAELGKLTGVVVGLACAADRWPKDARSRELALREQAHALSRELSEGRAQSELSELRRLAGQRFARAARAYDAVRGVGIAPSVLRGARDARPSARQAPVAGDESRRARVTRVAREEVAWFFGPIGGRVPAVGGPPAERLAGRAVEDWLRAILTFHRGALSLRYAREKEWPTWLTDQYGHWTSLVVRLECARHPSAGGKSDAEVEQESVRRFEAAFRGRWRHTEGIADLRARAGMHVRSALRAYDAARGGAPNVLPDGTAS